MFVTIHLTRPGTRLPRPLASPKTRRFKFSRPNTAICLSPFAATHARNPRVNPFAATHTKMALRKSFPCHTYEKEGGVPPGFCRDQDGVLFRELFSGKCRAGGPRRLRRARARWPVCYRPAKTEIS